MSIYEKLIEDIKKIDTDGLSDEVDKGGKVNILEKQKVYFWIRIMLKNEVDDLNIGDDIQIEYSKSGEKLVTKFITYGKKSLNKNVDNVIVSYDPEEDKKLLCLMVDEDEIKTSKSIPFIRTLFKSYPYYEFQVYRREDLTFTNLRNGNKLDYIDADF
jgi:hypothetical protein